LYLIVPILANWIILFLQAEVLNQLSTMKNQLDKLDASPSRDKKNRRQKLACFFFFKQFLSLDGAYEKLRLDVSTFQPEKIPKKSNFESN